ncbi:hypothetical protein CURTO8I2_60018 [Curtobacterium sp. 8I-2]|nr:hypothetical protein CURTO8I2_60018 [Curtobacterium sp. 8I-2]
MSRTTGCGAGHPGPQSLRDRSIRSLTTVTSKLAIPSQGTRRLDRSSASFDIADLLVSSPADTRSFGRGMRRRAGSVTIGSERWNRDG